ncbi:6-aminohexanoate-cyclic-dimer hydrolase [BD1-7 clade bacterium]|uniref:6-aminohexanoate-cyclic-dimer hydrolase n=1 Tax=BD1-7 clade bacterium TaxID=2029982 RepID=A0A5S9NMY6_9GAMM|nr:6-aminohexanoate-cyclic-dimer hydrolase [BD1-7 clade bacterium]CAA0094184.1 6-aminohexanoate-cyclic-dimer hydrolase [BD1-7 clade bacterium]
MNLHHYDATGLAALIRSGELSTAEAMEYSCQRIEKLNPALNAVVRTRFDKARSELNNIDLEAPFAGVPFLTKDLMAAINGEALGAGCASLQHRVMNHDANLVTRFRLAGLVILGQTNTPELGIMGITEPKVHGACRNPWDIQHTPGGSSGGSAAAVAAGLVPMASAGDGGGSIRIPASCCGLFGLKPSRNRQPLGPDIREAWGGAVVEHVLTRSVRDSAAMLDITNGADAGASVPVGRESGFSAASQQPYQGQYRIAYSKASPIGSDVHPDCIAALDDALLLLESLGHHVEEVTLPVEADRLASGYLTVLLGQVAKDVSLIALELGVKPRQLDIELPTEALYRIGKRLSARDYLLAQEYWNTLARSMGQLHCDYDFLLTPTLAAPPQPVGALYPSTVEQMSMRLLRVPGVSDISLKLGLVEQMAAKMLEKLPFTQIANLTGQPSMNVPLYQNTAGLPIGVQFTAAMGYEKSLFQLAGQLEQARDWKTRWPVMAA